MHGRRSVDWVATGKAGAEDKPSMMSLEIQTIIVISRNIDRCYTFLYFIFLLDVHHRRPIHKLPLSTLIVPSFGLLTFCLILSDTSAQKNIFELYAAYL